MKKGSKWLYRNFEANIYRFHKFWNTAFTNFEILILVLTSLLLKLDQKRPKFAYLFRKVIKELKGSQVEIKLIYQIQFVLERSKPDLYGLLEEMFSWRQFFKNSKNISDLWCTLVNGTACIFFQLFYQNLITRVYCNMLDRL